MGQQLQAGEQGGSGFDEEAGRGNPWSGGARDEHELLPAHSQCSHVSREYLTVRILVRVLALEGDRKIEKIYKVARRGEMHVLSQQKRAQQRADPSCYPRHHSLMPDPFPRRFCRGDARPCWYSVDVASI